MLTLQKKERREKMLAKRELDELIRWGDLRISQASYPRHGQDDHDAGPEERGRSWVRDVVHATAPSNDVEHGHE